MPAHSRTRTALAVVAAVFAALILVQVFLAGLGVFSNPSSFITHREFGYLIGWFTLVILILAVAGRMGRRIVGLAVVALVQMALQSVFILVRTQLPAVAALHPVNGVLLLLVVTVVGRAAWLARNAGGPVPATEMRDQAVVA
jgi:hypothetical protein